MVYFYLGWLPPGCLLAASWLAASAAAPLVASWLLATTWPPLGCLLAATWLPLGWPPQLQPPWLPHGCHLVATACCCLPPHSWLLTAITWYPLLAATSFTWPPLGCHQAASWLVATWLLLGLLPPGLLAATSLPATWPPPPATWLPLGWPPHGHLSTATWLLCLTWLPLGWSPPGHLLHLATSWPPPGRPPPAGRAA